MTSGRQTRLFSLHSLSTFIILDLGQQEQAKAVYTEAGIVPISIGEQETHRIMGRNGEVVEVHHRGQWNSENTPLHRLDCACMTGFRGRLTYTGPAKMSCFDPGVSLMDRDEFD
jgi:hypothetical protein